MESNKMAEQENTVTVDDVIYSIDDMTDEQKGLINLIQINRVTSDTLNSQAIQINHQLACVLNIGEAKRQELKASLLASADDSEEAPEDEVEEDATDEA
tara:strand:+ start:1147 stop:1443 length:297 start_codon:yes stop_codon:yes gene_type:complete